ncbi:uncharacterized protein A4U43_C03F20950 [Asparagus officinalis]|uniref:Uncharacterized protein n=1 Tax=Asparagus officinalis TaxID=4686 RepID=A0A5P1FCQ5_ASPOF|nr:uncharacterized protein A4U43_C03F20950 [Asparagus officinalis]
MSHRAQSPSEDSSPTQFEGDLVPLYDLNDWIIEDREATEFEEVRENVLQSLRSGRIMLRGRAEQSSKTKHANIGSQCALDNYLNEN